VADVPGGAGDEEGTGDRNNRGENQDQAVNDVCPARRRLRTDDFGGAGWLNSLRDFGHFRGSLATLYLGANRVHEIANVSEGLELGSSKPYGELFFEGCDQAGVREGVPSGDIGFGGLGFQHDFRILKELTENECQPLIDIGVVQTLILDRISENWRAVQRTTFGELPVG